MDGVMFLKAAIRHSGSLLLRWHCRRAVGNVVNIQCCQYQFSVPLWMCRGYGGKLAIGNIGNGNTFTLETLAIRSNPVGDTKKGEEAS